MNTVDLMLHTPIFDVVRGPEVQKNFRPVQVNSPDWVTIIVENSKNEFLCETQLRYGIMEECEEFPCGMVEKNEAPVHAALRELKEETGIEVNESKLVYLGKFAANPAFMTNYMHYFYIKLPDNADFDVSKQELDEHEQLSLMWEDKNKAYRKYLESHHSVIMAGGWLLLKDKGLF